LLKLIKDLPVSELDPNSIPFQIDKLGLGSLFNIASPGFIKQVSSSVHPYFQSKSCYLANSKVGTVTTIPRGDAHAGYGSSKDIVHALLFWTGSPVSAVGYDGDSQDTKVTAMIDLTGRLWEGLLVPEREQMLHLVCLCLMMSYPQYKRLCHRNCTERPMVYKFLVAVTEKPDSKKSIIKNCAKNTRFFVEQQGTRSLV
jgi:hypothetical protein